MYRYRKLKNSFAKFIKEDNRGKSLSTDFFDKIDDFCDLYKELRDIDFESDGPALESDTGAFPAKTNVEFVQVMSPTHLKMKVWERGAGPTLACGTGTCALVVAAIRAGKVPRAGKEGVRVTLPGGDLFIEWREENNKIYMSGPATFSFKGQATLKDRP